MTGIYTEAENSNLLGKGYFAGKFTSYNCGIEGYLEVDRMVVKEERPNIYFSPEEQPKRKIYHFDYPSGVARVAGFSEVNNKRDAFNDGLDKTAARVLGVPCGRLRQELSLFRQGIVDENFWRFLMPFAKSRQSEEELRKYSLKLDMKDILHQNFPSKHFDSMFNFL